MNNTTDVKILNYLNYQLIIICFYRNQEIFINIIGKTILFQIALCSFTLTITMFTTTIVIIY